MWDAPMKKRRVWYDGERMVSGVARAHVYVWMTGRRMRRRRRRRRMRRNLTSFSL